MDPNFQTSFIPKKPLAQDRVPVEQHTSLYSFIATLLFFGALASLAGVYFYQASLTKNIASMKADLDKAKNSFELDLIKNLQVLDRRISDSKELLNNHIAVSPIFTALETNTLKSIQFTKFSYLTPTDSSAPVVIHMSGRARDYASIALESDQLAKNTNIHNSIFSNLALDEQTGSVTFDLEFNVDAELVHFTNHLDTLVNQSGTPTQAPSTTPVIDTTTPTPSTTNGSAPQAPTKPIIPNGGQ